MKAPLFLTLCIGCLGLAGDLRAQSGGPAPATAGAPVLEGALQYVDGSLHAGDDAIYEIAGLRKGQILRIQVNRQSGNLDPFVAILDSKKDPVELVEGFRERLEQALEAEVDLDETLPELIDRATLAWNDDSGPRHSAQLEYEIPADGNHPVLVRSTPVINSFGRFQVVVTVDAELPGKDELEENPPDAWGELEITLNTEASRTGTAVEETNVELTAGEPQSWVELDGFGAGDRFFVRIEAFDPASTARVELHDYVGKPVQRITLEKGEKFAQFDYEFVDNQVNYRLEITGEGLEEEDPPARFRLVLGVNAPWVQQGNASPRGRPIIRQPIVVKVGLKVQQITFVKQAEENFGVVASIRLDWTDPELAFDPDEVQRPQLIFAGDRFAEFAGDRGVRWPEFTLYNQQGNRWVQNRIVQLDADGTVSYVERFSVTMQAPDFNFHMYPFDRQAFYVRVHSVMRDEYFVFEELEDYSDLGTRLGEEEWSFLNWQTSLAREAGSTGTMTSRFIFKMEAERHLSYYLYRILLPVLFIVVISWLTFFLKEYTKRVDLCSANLLLFIAFNFTISGNLPRLGYLTFLDKILIGAFCITASMVIFSIMLRFLEHTDRHSLARKLDRIFFWIYLLIYIAGVFAVTNALSHS